MLNGRRPKKKPSICRDFVAVVYWRLNIGAEKLLNLWAWVCFSAKKQQLTNECLTKGDTQLIKPSYQAVCLQQNVHLERVLPETGVERVKCATKIHLSNTGLFFFSCAICPQFQRECAQWPFYFYFSYVLRCSLHTVCYLSIQRIKDAQIIILDMHETRVCVGVSSCLQLDIIFLVSIKLDGFVQKVATVGPSMYFLTWFLRTLLQT